MSGGLDLTAVMDGLAAAVQTKLASDKKCYAWPTEDVTSGDAVVGYPDPTEIAITFGRGADRATFPVWFIGGYPQDKTTRDTLADVITGTGSLITAIETYSTSAWSSVAVKAAEPFFEPYQPVGRPAQLALRFNVDLIS